MSDHKIEVRPALVEDAGAVSIMADMMVDELKCIDRDMSYEAVRCLFVDHAEQTIESNGVVVIAKVDEKYAGCVLWYTSFPGSECVGYGTWVRPEYRRLGLSDRMRAVAVEIAKSRGASCVVGTVLGDNRAGVSAMSKTGFICVGMVYKLPL